MFVFGSLSPKIIFRVMFSNELKPKEPKRSGWIWGKSVSRARGSTKPNPSRYDLPSLQSIPLSMFLYLFYFGFPSPTFLTKFHDDLTMEFCKYPTNKTGALEQNQQTNTSYSLGHVYRYGKVKHTTFNFNSKRRHNAGYLEQLEV